MPRTVCYSFAAAALAIALTMPRAAQAQQPVRVNLPAYSDLVMLDSMRTETELSAAPERVYAGVLKAYFDLGIPTGNTDNKAGIIGSEKFERIHQLAGAPMSRSFSCGESANGPNADSYRITIVVVVWVKPGKSGGSVLGIAVAASGADLSGSFRVPRPCASNGRIEQKILDAVEKYVK